MILLMYCCYFYDRLNEKVYLNDYIEQYYSVLEIDNKVKQDVLREIMVIGNRINKSNIVTNIMTSSNEILNKTNDFEGNNLNAESVVKK